MSDGEWFFTREGRQQGPVTGEALRSMLAAGQVGWSDMVWKAGMTGWLPAGSVASLAPAGAMSPPPLPVQPIGYATPQPRELGDDVAMRLLLPVGQSGWAIASGYLGLVSILMLPAPFAIICGILAIREIRRNPRKHGMGRAIFGIAMGIICLLLLAWRIQN